MSRSEGGDRVTRWMRWIARIWGTVVLGVVLLVLAGYTTNWVRTGVADPHAAEEYPFAENLPPLFILLSAIGLGIAWRWEGWGGAVAVLFQLAALPVLLIHWPLTEGMRNVVPYLVSLVVAIPGILSLVCWWRSGKRATSPDQT